MNVATRKISSQDEVLTPLTIPQEEEDKHSSFEQTEE